MKPPEVSGKDEQVATLHGQEFDLADDLERDCYAQGRHQYSQSKYAIEDDILRGWRQCQHCFRSSKL